MTTAWRIVKKRHVGAAFDGEGARRYGGRWSSAGTAVAYASETRALGLLEVLAGLRSVRPIQAYVIIPATFDPSMVVRVETHELPSKWRRHPPHPSTQRIGDEWVDENRSAILRVPSAIVPDESNYLLNPAHAEFRRIRIGPPEEVTVDPRLLP